MATQRDKTELSVEPLAKEQRQRLECLTAVRNLFCVPGYNKTPSYQPTRLHEVIELADYLMTGRS